MSAPAVTSVYPSHSAVLDGRLLIGGCDAAGLAREFGTPAYVVAEEALRARAREFRAALAEHHDGPGAVLFAAKAFSCAPVLRVFAEEGLSCLVSTGGELHLALRAGFDPERIQLHGNAKSTAELEMALAAGVGTIVIDSFDDLERLERLAGEGRRRRVLIRVMPGVETDTHAKIATGHADVKFGMGLEDAARALERIRAGGRLEAAGLHMHLGSQLFDYEPFRAGVAALLTLGEMDVYDLGGGLGVPYTREDPMPSVDEYVAAKARALRELAGPGKTLLIEPGRALSASACVTLYTVQTVKRGSARTWVAVDGGMSDNLRPTLYGARYEIAAAERMHCPGQACTVVGKHCESGDELGRDVELPDPRPGDVLVTPVTGAYGHSLASNYNAVPRPPVVFCADGEARLAVRRETYEDLVARDV
ncbi:MAG: Diaminopimelate decarboxylase [uncultured Solirubrobacteraceae bacterium]|uniref:Diaminopimelate decarboxylase n=1 Tax=uncultured Solirubrobacteraceae bacterium TaxID=1162706 RepID=A0A6J4SG39_9ACTN|nr:MAG: Diaminopimelate decarboxylase [uncultured Solirubrobacteraceae bacterium]